MKTLLCMLLAAVCLALRADDPPEIAGAFGVQLGRPFKGMQATSTNELAGGSVAYFFTPTNGVPPFVTYIAAVTPKSRVVYAVVAKAGKIERSEASVEADKLKLMLSRKYGEPAPESAESRLKGAIRWRLAKRMIELVNVRFGEPELSLTYADDDLLNRAEREAAELKAKGVDDSGL